MKDKLYALCFALLMISAGGMFWLSVHPAFAEDQDSAIEEAQIEEQEEVVYGSQLMTPEERMEYRDRMRAATTDEERAMIRAEHHEQMKERAKEQGITLPDDMPERGMGRGMGTGGSMGPGGRNN